MTSPIHYLSHWSRTTVFTCAWYTYLLYCRSFVIVVINREPFLHILLDDAGITITGKITFRWKNTSTSLLSPNDRLLLGYVCVIIPKTINCISTDYFDSIWIVSTILCFIASGHFVAFNIEYYFYFTVGEITNKTKMEVSAFFFRILKLCRKMNPNYSVLNSSMTFI